ncbi:MAG: hypothetical protein MZV63_32260 [Marinilabiliales bacterium]|nr:hypothetical protein [Marinilabiliales bacterium]
MHCPLRRADPPSGFRADTALGQKAGLCTLPLFLLSSPGARLPRLQGQIAAAERLLTPLVRQ